jgi:uncharacterized protein
VPDAWRNGDRVLCAGGYARHPIGKPKKDDPAEVARIGFDAMMRGDGDVLSGWKNKLQSALANVMPAATLARHYKKMAAPGSARR